MFDKPMPSRNPFWESPAPSSATLISMESPAARAAIDAMADGVLHQRLEDEERDGDVEQRGIDVHADRKPIAEADAEDVEIGFEHRELLAQRSFMDALPLQAQAQQIA